MICILLAAGTSSRLYPLTDSTPKCLLQVGKYTILERAIRYALLHEISDFIIVTGFQASMIRKFVQETFPALHVKFIHNERFEETNNIYSLALATTALREKDVILMDSDIVFDQRILSELFSSPHENCLVVRREEDLKMEEIKVCVGKDWRVLRIGKERGKETPIGESIGIEKFSSSGAKKLFQIVGRRVLTEKREQEFYEAAFQELIDSGVPIYGIDAGEYPCIEIDTLEDLQRAREFVAPRLDTP